MDLQTGTPNMKGELKSQLNAKKNVIHLVLLAFNIYNHTDFYKLHFSQWN